MSEFTVGQKVRIKEGGWGIHPVHVGKIVTIHGTRPNGRYTLEEDLNDGEDYTLHRKHECAADGRSFEALAESESAETTDQIRAVNALIKAENTRIAEADAVIEEAERVKSGLNRQRQTLIATLLRELDV